MAQNSKVLACVIPLTKDFLRSVRYNNCENWWLWRSWVPGTFNEAIPPRSTGASRRLGLTSPGPSKRVSSRRTRFECEILENCQELPDRLMRDSTTDCYGWVRMHGGKRDAAIIQLCATRGCGLVSCAGFSSQILRCLSVRAR